MLLETLNHLFTKILNREGHGFDWSTGLTATSLQSPKAFLHLYHFLYDRLRSIRQDFVVQVPLIIRRNYCVTLTVNMGW